MIPQEWFHEAHRRIGDTVIRTPLTYDPDLHVYLKWENRQRTGSFKIRGALNKVLSLRDWELQRGLVTASAGNHGQGVAVAAQMVGARVIVFASDHAVPSKLDAMRALGAEVRCVEGGYAAAEQAAIAFSAQYQMTWVSPYNDAQIIAGQGTLGLEILSQLAEQNVDPQPRTVIVPVGGGGLLAGVALALEASGEHWNVLGAQSTASSYFHALLMNGSQANVIERDSLADGLAGAVEEGSITIPIVKRCASEIRLVEEAAVAGAVVLAWERYGETIEGAAAAALAAGLAGAASERLAVILISGGNIQPEVHAALRAGQDRR